MSIAYKEGIKIPPPALNEIILASNQDVRQVKSSKHGVLQVEKFSHVFPVCR